MTTSKGSGLLSAYAAAKPHLLTGPGGALNEIETLALAVMQSFSAVKALAIEEFIYPAAAHTAAVMTATATTAAATTYQTTALNGAVGSPVGGVGGGAIVPPRNLTVTTAGSTSTHAPTTVTFHGLDAKGNALSETITGVNGGAATYTGVKCFAKVLSAVCPAAGGTDATLAFGTGIVVGLSTLPKIRAGLALPLIGKEIYDGAAVTNGALTLPATNPPFGAYTPGTAPSDLGPATHTGTADITSAGLYGAGGTLAGGGTPLTLIMNVNGGGALTLTFDGTGGTSSASEAAMLAAIVAEWPALTAVESATHLKLTTLLQGAQGVSIVVGAGTANTALGLTTTTYNGTGHVYCIDYEMTGS